MLSFLPSWVSDIMLILAFIAGPTGLIWGFLQRKDANRKLVVEEGGLEVDQFEAQRQAFNDLLREQREITARALAELADTRKELSESRDQRKEMADDIEDLRSMLIQTRDLFKRVVARSNIVLTPDEQREFDATKPPRPRRRIRPAQAG
jgi:septal ring factor EnvC (AmiA/AmiB activator)